MAGDPVDRSSRSQASGWALWELGFRPLFLGAGIFAVVAMLLWLGQFTGTLSGIAYLTDPYWHAHEMIFGYAMAVIAGFLFTAVRNWTGSATPSGWRLAGIVVLWVAGRVLLATPWPIIAAASDTAFTLAVATGIAVPLISSGNRRNLSFIALLLVLAGANLVFHLAMNGFLQIPVRNMLQLALNVVALIVALISGRVIPMFTANGAPGAKPARKAVVEFAAIAGLICLTAADFARTPPVAIAIIAGASAAAHGVRLALWQPWRTLGRPILWILHASYAWLVLYLVLRTFAEFGMISPSLATHALTVGAVGGMTLGMMTRTARGHTGRPLQAGKAETLCYALINLAALARVFVPLALPAFYSDAVVISGLLWSAAFAVFVFKFSPILTRPRIDGRPG